MLEPIKYEFEFSGRCGESGDILKNQTRIIQAYDIGDAERKLKRDYLTINIYFKGIAI